MSPRFLTILVALVLVSPDVTLRHAAAADAHADTSVVAANDLKKLQVMDGLKVELFASEPLFRNPVAFTFDRRGRVFVAETYRYGPAVFDITANTPWLLDDLSCRTVHDRAAFLARTFATNSSILTNTSELVRLIEDRDGDGRADASSVFADGFRDPVAGPAAGVLAQGDDVWLTCIPDLWRLAATPPESHTRERLVTGLGVHISVSGHDVHGLIRGPDGRIYFSFGDRGVNVTNREGAVLDVADSGGVLRCEPDGSALEIFCVGLRNPQELAFDDLGNLWTVDNDTAGADPCRVLHLVQGADYGWRSSYQHMKGFGPWVLEELWRGGLDGVPPLAGTVSQGPAGLAFFPGASLTPALAGQFLHADFPGGIWAFSVQPRGASYALAGKQKVLWNCWPTDVEFGPDGALYVLDWVQGWTAPAKGRIYRLSATGSAAERSPAAADVKRLLAEGISGRGPDELLALLSHVDRRIRLEAQWALATRGTNSIAGLVRAAASPDVSRGQAPPLGRLHALWGLRQIIRRHPDSAHALAQAALPLLRTLLVHENEELRGQAAAVIGEAGWTDSAGALNSILRDGRPRERLLALDGLIAGASRNAARINPRALSGPAGTPALPRTVSDSESDPFLLDRMAEWMSRHPGGAVLESEPAPGAASALTAVWAMRRQRDPRIEIFLTNTAPRLVLEAARAINDAPIPDAYPALAGLLNDGRFVDESGGTNWGRAAIASITPAGPPSGNARSPRDQVLRRALNAHFRLGKIANAEALTAFALNGKLGLNPVPLRVEALELLARWEILPGRVGDLPIKPAKDPNHGSIPSVNPENWPGWFDRVVGLWRPLPPRSGELAARALSPFIERLIADSNDEIALAAMDAVVRLQLTNAAPALLARLESARAPAPIRRRVPSALAGIHASELPEAIRRCLADPEAGVRAAALPYLNRLEADRALEVLKPLLLAAITDRTPSAETRGPRPSDGERRLVQGAFRALASVQNAEADALLLTLFETWKAGRYPQALALDLMEAMDARPSSRLRAGLDAIGFKSPPGDDVAAWKSALHGGDAERGRTLFFDKTEVQCARCHQVKKEGGTVGPALDGVGRRLSREAIMESILRPNAVIAAGFESVLLTLKNGDELAGVIKTETEQHVNLESIERGLQSVAKADIAERRRSLSAMPEGLSSFLTRREARDLVEFLAELK